MVIAVPMSGQNNKPEVDFPRFGIIKFYIHDQLKLLESDDYSPLKLFIEPVLAGINHVQKKNSFSDINMVGLSGGGWVSTIYPALDPRIKRSYPVAGSMPIFLRTGHSGDWGDYEQTHMELLKTATYIELYIMAAHKPGRKHIQIINVKDPCCFWGDRYKYYESNIQETLSAINGGTFDVFPDDSHNEHKISDIALNFIVKDMQK